MTWYHLLTQCRSLAPEIVLSAAVCAALLADMLIPLRKSRAVCGLLGAAGGLASIGCAVSLFGLPTTFFFSDTVVVDKLAIVFKLLFTAGGLIALLFGLRSRELEGKRFGEFVALLFGAVLGACLMASADNFVIFILGMETLSFCSYVLAAYLKHSRFSAEAGLKYVLFGAIASGVMLFGLSYLYGLSGSLSIAESMRILVPGVHPAGSGIFSLVALSFVLAGIGFKIAVVPFHSWCPDVYQGSPTAVTAFLSVVSKAAGFAALLRFLAPLLSTFSFAETFDHGAGLGALQLTIGVLAVITMTFGNLVAIRQENVKRLLAYSSIAHAGYLLAGLTVLNPDSVEAVLMYLCVYLFMNLGAFWVVIILENSVGSSNIETFRGASFKAPLLFTVLFICLISLTGLPPTAGFVAKFRLFGVIISAGIDSMGAGGILSAASVFYFAVALIAVLNSAVSLYYYMRVASVMVFKQPLDETPLAAPAMDKLLAVALSIPLLVLLNFGPLFSLVRGVVPHVEVRPAHSAPLAWESNV